MKPVLFFNAYAAEDAQDERAAAGRYFEVFGSRMRIPKGSVVAARYGVLPFYKELEQDLREIGSALLNTYAQHQWIAEMLGWSGADGTPGVLEGLTPQTWTAWHSLPSGAFVLKGRTNSRKSRWNTHMFAPTREAVPEVALRLLGDDLVSSQGLAVRQYIALRELTQGFNGLPITNEWRTFWLVVDGELRLITKGFYWAKSHPEVQGSASFPAEALDLAYEAARRVAPHVSFFVLDLAEKREGGWVIIEVNDAQMSGLCGCPPDEFYRSLAEHLGDRHARP